MSAKSLESMEQFLAYLGEKGLLTPAAAANRKAAVAKIFSVLSEEERNDVFEVELDDVVNRFTNLHGKEYKPGSLQAYISRVRASLDDFRRYVDDPVNFKISKGSSAKPGKKTAETKGKSAGSASQTSHSVSSSLSSMTVSETMFPVPIRENVVVKIYGLPFDLSEAEANKIANVIRAMAM